jgi:hypothetical protein
MLQRGEIVMYRIISVVAALLVVTVVQPATARDDVSVCEDAAPDTAAAACNRILALDPEDAVAYTNRGTAYLRKLDYNLAIADHDFEPTTNRLMEGI